MKKMIKNIAILLLIIGIVFALRSLYLEYKTYKLNDELLTELENQMPDPVIDREIQPGEVIPTTEVEDLGVIGILEIPNLGLKVPIADCICEKRLLHYVSRYSGELYGDNLVLGGRNYWVLLRGLYKLEPTDEIIITDIYGRERHYNVSGMVTLDETEVEELVGSDFDLAIFTGWTNSKDRFVIWADENTENS